MEGIAGGMSCALGMLMRHLLLEPGNLMEGVVLNLAGSPTPFFAKFCVHLGDEAAPTEMAMIKGSKGKSSGKVQEPKGKALGKGKVIWPAGEGENALPTGKGGM